MGFKGFAKSIAFVLGCLMFVSIIGCGNSYVYSPTPDTYRWVTINGEDYNPNLDTNAPMFEEGKTPDIISDFVFKGDTIYFLIREENSNKFIRCVKYIDGKILNLDDTKWKSSPTKLFLSPFNEANEPSSFAIDSNGFPHIVWSDKPEYIKTLDHNKDIYYAKWDGQDWYTIQGQKVNIESDNANVSRNVEICSTYSPRIALGSKDNPHIVWRSHNRENQSEEYIYLNYLKWGGKNWLTSDGTQYKPRSNSDSIVGRFSNAEISGDYFSTFPIIKMDKDDNPHIFGTTKIQVRQKILNTSFMRKCISSGQMRTVGFSIMGTSGIQLFDF